MQLTSSSLQTLNSLPSLGVFAVLLSHFAIANSFVALVCDATRSALAAETTKFALFFRGQPIPDDSASAVFELFGLHRSFERRKNCFKKARTGTFFTVISKSCRIAERTFVGVCSVAKRLSMHAHCSQLLRAQLIQLTQRLVGAVEAFVDDALSVVSSKRGCGALNTRSIGLVWERCEQLGACELSNVGVARDAIKAVLSLIKDAKDELQELLARTNDDDEHDDLHDIDDDDDDADDDDEADNDEGDEDDVQYPLTGATRERAEAGVQLVNAMGAMLSSVQTVVTSTSEQGLFNFSLSVLSKVKSHENVTL